MKKTHILCIAYFEKEWYHKLFADYDSHFTFSLIDPHTVPSSADLEHTEIIWGNISPRYLSLAPNLKWLQLVSAGNEAYTKENFPQNAILTNASGSHGCIIAEHLTMSTLMLFRNALTYFSQQQKHVWNGLDKSKSIYGSRFLIIGCGAIGTTYAQTVYAMGGYTIGVKKHKTTSIDGFCELHTTEALESLLPTADVITLAVPNTPSTNLLLDKKRLSLMKQDAVLLNVGRGNALDEHALSEMLNTNKLSGAALDVFEQEPLSSDSPLWDTKNLIITPHSSGGFSATCTVNSIKQLFVQNLKSYINNETLSNIVDFDLGYRNNTYR